jgi:plastocyanin
MTYAPGHASKHSTDRWENEGGPAHSAAMPSSPDDLQSELKKHGITPVQLTVYDCGGYRYSSARDAIAAAKRLTSGGAK